MKLVFIYNIRTEAPGPDRLGRLLFTSWWGLCHA